MQTHLCASSGEIHWQGIYISQVKPFQFGKTGGYMEKPAKDAALAFSDLTTWTLQNFHQQKR